MRSTKSGTLYLWATSETEREMWRDILAPFSWADGEFGMLCTDSRFFDFCDELQSRSDVAPVVVRQVKRYASLLKRHHYGELCLNQGVVSHTSRRLKR